MWAVNILKYSFMFFNCLRNMHERTQINKNCSSKGPQYWMTCGVPFRKMKNMSHWFGGFFVFFLFTKASHPGSGMSQMKRQLVLHSTFHFIKRHPTCHKMLQTHIGSVCSINKLYVICGYNSH